MLSKEMFLLSCKSVVVANTTPTIALIFIEPTDKSAEDFHEAKGVRMMVLNPHDMSYNMGNLLVKENNPDAFAAAVDAWADEHKEMQVGVGLSCDEIQVATFEDGNLIAALHSDNISYCSNINMGGSKE